jgi:hypothetical protein
MRPDHEEREGRPTPAKVETASVSTEIKNTISVAMAFADSRHLVTVVSPW